MTMNSPANPARVCPKSASLAWCCQAAPRDPGTVCVLCFDLMVTGTFAFLSLFMHYLKILQVSQGPDPPKVPCEFPSFQKAPCSALSLPCLCHLLSRHWILPDEGALCLRRPQCWSCWR